MEKTPIKVALERQIPEYIRGEYQLFVDFIKAYYEFLDQSQQRNLEDIRSIENTLEEFVTRFKKELSVLFPTNTLENERFILQRIREFYQSRGSKESFQFLFRILFNKDSDVFYPSTQILRASDGKWIQEKSLFVRSQAGNLFNLSNKIILIETNNKTIYVYCPRVVYYREDIYEVFIDRSYIQDISLSNIVKSENGADYGEIIPCPNKYTIVSEGSGFEVGQLYYLKSELGDGSLIKITRTNSNGGIKKVQIISFGLDYESTFYARLSNKQAVALPYYSPIQNFSREFTATAGQTTFNIAYTPGSISVYKNNVLLASNTYTATNGTSVVLSTPASLNDTIKIVTINTNTPFQDRTEGFIDFGYISKQTYLYLDNFYTNSSPGGGFTANQPQSKFYSDGSYVGEIVGSFYTVDTTSSLLSDSAEIKIELGPVAVYPGYYQTSDGFISDESYIQDGKYYQLFSYVIKVEQQIDTYLDVVKQLLHPAGMELFAEYTIKNEYVLSASPLLAFIRRQFLDQVFVTDDEATNDVDKINADFLSTPLALFTHDVFGSSDKNNIFLSVRKYDSDGVLLNESNQNKWSTIDPFTENRYDMLKGSANDPITNSIVNHESDFENNIVGSGDFYVLLKGSSSNPLTNSIVTHESDFENNVIGSGDFYELLKGSAENPLTNSIVTHESSFNHDNPLFDDRYIILKGSVNDPITNSIVTHESSFNHNNPLFNDRYVILKGSANDPLTNSTVSHNSDFNHDNPLFDDLYHLYKGSSSNPITNSLVNHNSDFNHNNPSFNDLYVILKGSAENPLTNSTVNHSSDFNHNNPSFNDLYVVEKFPTESVDVSLNPHSYSLNKASSSTQSLLDSFDRLVVYERSFSDTNTVVDLYLNSMTRDTISDSQSIIDLLTTISRDLYRAPQLTLQGTVTAGSDIITLSGYSNNGVQPGRTLIKVSGTGAIDTDVLVKESNIGTSSIIRMTKNAITTGSIVFTTGFETPALADTLSSPTDSFPDGQLVDGSRPVKFLFSSIAGGTWADSQVSVDSFNREVTYIRSIADVNIPLEAISNFSLSGSTWADSQTTTDLRVSTEFTWTYSETINNTNTGTLYFNAYSQDTSDPASSYSYFETDYAERLTTALS